MDPSDEDYMMTKKRKKDIKEVEYLKERFQLPFFYVHYLDNKNKTYCKESKEIVLHFLKNYSWAMPVGSVVFHDSGSCFGKKNESVFEEAGLLGPDWLVVVNQIYPDRHFFNFPPKIHEHLSTCDNGWFGPVKAKWRAPQRKGNDAARDDMISSLHLYYELLNTKDETIVDAFNRNFFLKNKNAPTKKEILRFLEGKNHGVIRSERAYQAMSAYYTSQQSEEKYHGKRFTGQKKLFEHFDGEYFTKEGTRGRRPKRRRDDK